MAVSAAARAAVHLRTATPPPSTAWTAKAARDFVTDVDRAAERLIGDALLAGTPGSVIVGEELSPERRPQGDLVWYVDPLDGTTNFLHGYPQFAVSIAGVLDGRLAVAVVHDVPRDIVYRAALGQGAWAGDRRLAVSTITDPLRSLIGTGFPFKREDEFATYQRQFGAVARGAAAIRRAGAASLDLADVAQGRFEGFWELSLAPWDVAAGVLLIREAGGVATTLDGAPEVLRHGGIVAGNTAVHAWLLTLLGSA